MIISHFARIVAHHDFTLELVHAHGKVAALDSDDGAPVHWPTQRLDTVDDGLGTHIALPHWTVLGELTPSAAPDTAQVSSSGQTQGTVGVALVAAHQGTLVQADVGPVHHVVAVPYHRYRCVVLTHTGLILVSCLVTNHTTGLQTSGNSKLGSLDKMLSDQHAHYYNNDI